MIVIKNGSKTICFPIEDITSIYNYYYGEFPYRRIDGKRISVDGLVLKIDDKPKPTKSIGYVLELKDATYVPVSKTFYKSNIFSKIDLEPIDVLELPF